MGSHIFLDYEKKLFPKAFLVLAFYFSVVLVLGLQPVNVAIL